MACPGPKRGGKRKNSWESTQLKPLSHQSAAVAQGPEDCRIACTYARTHTQNDQTAVQTGHRAHILTDNVHQRTQGTVNRHTRVKSTHKRERRSRLWGSETQPKQWSLCVFQSLLWVIHSHHCYSSCSVSLFPVHSFPNVIFSWQFTHVLWLADNSIWSYRDHMVMKLWYSCTQFWHVNEW